MNTLKNELRALEKQPKKANEDYCQPWKELRTIISMKLKSIFCDEIH